ncbi:MAG: hypothetical protein ABSH19_09515 [Opitutales bacterium]|jgi:hypothetical protein
MIFIAPRNRQQYERLWFFESFRVWRDGRTDQWVVMWRRGRCLSLLVALLAFFYFGSVAAATWWLQALSPGLPVTYASMLSPIYWFRVPHIWNAYQLAITEQEENKASADHPASSPTPILDQDVGETPAAGSSPSPAIASVMGDNQAYSPRLSQFFAHNGGAQQLLAIRSINAQGTVTLSSGETLKFTLIKKPPNKVHLNIHDNASTNENTIITDGQDSWKWIDDPYKNGVRHTLPDELNAILREALYCDVPIEVIQHVHDVTEPAGQDATDHSFILQLPGGMQAKIFPDPETWRPSRIEIDYQQNGHANTNVITVNDWMTVNGLPEPADISVTLNDKPLLECHFNAITYNVGVYDILFQPPGGAPAAPMPPATPSTPPAPPPAGSVPASSTKE